jgi:peptidoglycan/xylan/chitin deacetylase (PgdA/CDA1 family)
MRGGAGRTLVVFGWHSVGPTWFTPSPRRTALRGLERQLRGLRAGFSVVPLGEALERLESGGHLPRRAAAITFDDGYRDNLELAAPLLRRLGLPATFFLVPSLLDGARAWWEVVAWAFARSSRDELAWEGGRWPLAGLARRRAAMAEVCERLKPRDRAARDRAVDELVEGLAPRGAHGDGLFLDWDGARRLARVPGAEIGSHSRHHEILSRESAAAQVADLAEARRRLMRELDLPVLGLAYPNGTRADYDERTVAAARAAGHRWAITSETGVNRAGTPAYELRRAMVSPGEGAAGLLRPWPVRSWIRARLPAARAAAGRAARASPRGS